MEPRRVIPVAQFFVGALRILFVLLAVPMGLILVSHPSYEAVPVICALTAPLVASASVGVGTPVRNLLFLVALVAAGITLAELLALADLMRHA
jgi:hypothetical protein